MPERDESFYNTFEEIFGRIRDRQILYGVACVSSVDEYFDHIWLQLIGIKP